jgi:hypothetical protein
MIMKDANDSTKLKTVGFSVMHQPGDFRLELDSIQAVNLPGTLGDFDILKEGQYIDESGNLRTVKEGDMVPLFPGFGKKGSGEDRKE